jgi:tyrosyl-tRNA synthetase
MIHDAFLREALAPLARTVDTVIPEADLVRKWKAGRPLRVKFGIDPTATSVHVGNGIPLWNLRRLQDMGHQPVLILGDYTAQVGDPSGKDKTRPMLGSEQVEANISTWMSQIGRILDLEGGGGRLPVEVRRNGEWFSRMPFLEVLRLADRMTVQQMLERDSFERRAADGTPISIREFLYCLMQGWDSVMVRADVELGGTDQTFNLGVGRRLMEQEGLEPQVAVVSPLVEGTDGHAKMSKSLGNSIGLEDAPADVFGKAMRVSDALLPKFLRLLTDLPDAEIEALLRPEVNPRDAKLRMAESLVARYHGAAAGRAEREAWVRVISEGRPPEDIPEVAVPAGPQTVWALVRACGFAKSNSEARRLLQQGAVTYVPASGEGGSTPAETATLEPREGDVLKVGNRRYARLKVAT